MSLCLQHEGDCGYFEWFDPPTSKWIKELLLDLKDAVFRLKRERGEPFVDEAREHHVQELELMNQSLQRQLMKKEDEMLKKEEELVKKEEELLKKEEEVEVMQKQLDALEQKMKGMKKNGCSSCCVFMFVFVMALLVAKFMNGCSK